MEAQLKSHGFSVQVGDPQQAHTYAPPITFRTLRVYLNNTYLGSFNPMWELFFVKDPRLATWAHIMGYNYHGT